MESNTFTKTMRTAATIVQGENGENKLSSSGSPRIDAFTLLLQTSEEDTIKETINRIVREATTATESVAIIEDLFVLAFHKRGTSKKNNDGEITELYFNVIGRSDEMLIIKGINIFPSAIADQIYNELNIQSRFKLKNE